MIFLDGVGIGNADPNSNPFFARNFRFLNDVFGSTPHLKQQHLNNGNAYLFPADACLGVQGLPQSGTGQTSIFCGVNASKITGFHFGPFPHSELLPVIKEKNIFAELLRMDKKVTFANAYPKVFFDYIRSGKKRLSVTSLSCRMSGVKLNTSLDLRRGKALTAEITNSRWVNKLNYKLPVISPETAAKRLLKIAYEHDYTLFEYFLSDHYGHGRIAELEEDILETLDRFLFYLLTKFDSEKGTLIICSDHGNLEDISIKMHTLNPALTITLGKHAAGLSERIKSLPDIKPAIIDLYK